MRSMGVKPGVADWQFLIHGGSIWIELKTETGKQSPDQFKFELLCLSLGHRYEIIRSEDEMFNLISLYL